MLKYAGVLEILTIIKTHTAVCAFKGVWLSHSLHSLEFWEVVPTSIYFELCDLWTQWQCKRHLEVSYRCGTHNSSMKSERIHGQNGLHDESVVNMDWRSGQWFGKWSSGCGEVLPRCPSGGDTHCSGAQRVGCWQFSTESLSKNFPLPKVMIPPRGGRWGRPTSNDWSMWGRVHSPWTQFMTSLRSHLSSRVSHGVYWDPSFGCIVVQLFSLSNPSSLSPSQVFLRAPQ